MKLTFIGHACFLCESEAGLRVLLDPYRPGAFDGRIGLRSFLEPVDIVASTHNHLDHFHLDKAFGRPKVVRWSRLHVGSRRVVHATHEVLGITFQGLSLPHGAERGREGGFVAGIRFTMDGVSVFHPGDLGRPLNEEEVRVLGRVDVLLVPVGGTFTIGPEDALVLIRSLRPAVAIPMHYRMERVVDLRLRPRDDFLELVTEHDYVREQPLSLDPVSLPEPTRIIVLDPTHAKDAG